MSRSNIHSNCKAEPCFSKRGSGFCFSKRGSSFYYIRDICSKYLQTFYPFLCIAVTHNLYCVVRMPWFVVINNTSVILSKGQDGERLHCPL